MEFRTSHQALLRQVSDHVGADNDRYIQQAAQRSEAIILGSVVSSQAREKAIALQIAA